MEPLIYLQNQGGTDRDGVMRAGFVSLCFEGRGKFGVRQNAAARGNCMQADEEVVTVEIDVAALHNRKAMEAREARNRQRVTVFNARVTRVLENALSRTQVLDFVYSNSYWLGIPEKICLLENGLNENLFRFSLWSANYDSEALVGRASVTPASFSQLVTRLEGIIEAGSEPEKVFLVWAAVRKAYLETEALAWLERFPPENSIERAVDKHVEVFSANSLDARTVTGLVCHLIGVGQFNESDYLLAYDTVFTLAQNRFNELQAKLQMERQAELERLQMERQAELERLQMERQAELEAKLQKERQAELEAKLQMERQAEQEARLQMEHQAELETSYRNCVSGLLNSEDVRLLIENFLSLADYEWLNVPRNILLMECGLMSLPQAGYFVDNLWSMPCADCRSALTSPIPKQFDVLSKVLNRYVAFPSETERLFATWHVVRELFVQRAATVLQLEMQPWGGEEASYLDKVILAYIDQSFMEPTNPKSVSNLASLLVSSGHAKFTDFLLVHQDLSARIQRAVDQIAIDDFEKMLRRPTHKSVTIDDVDLMTGEEFEALVARIFTCLGYDAVVTQATGDQGVDVIASKGGTRLGIQAKCYSGPVPNGAVQEIVAGLRYYGLNRGLVVTNNQFTSSAAKLARANNILLWDRSLLKEKLHTLE